MDDANDSQDNETKDDDIEKNVIPFQNLDQFLNNEM